MRAIIVMIGSMDHPERFAEARRRWGDPAAIWLIPSEPVPMAEFLAERVSRCPRPDTWPKLPTSFNLPRNGHRGEWLWAVDCADVVLVVCRPGGSLGPGTVEELRHAMGAGRRVEWS